MVVYLHRPIVKANQHPPQTAERFVSEQTDGSGGQEFILDRRCLNVYPSGASSSWWQYIQGKIPTMISFHWRS